MKSYGKKFVEVINGLLTTKNFTKTGTRLFTKFTVTANPQLITELFDDPTLTRSAVTRRMLEQGGASNSLVSHDDATNELVKPYLKEFLNSKVYKNCLEEVKLVAKQELEKSNGKSIDIFNFFSHSLTLAFLEHWLGIDTKDPEVREKMLFVTGRVIDEAGSRLILEQTTAMMLLNYLPIPLFVRNLVYPRTRRLHKFFNNVVQKIYDNAELKPGLWLEKLKELEKNNIITHDMVLGEIKSVYISASTLSSALTMGVYLLSISAKDTNNYYIDRIIANKKYSINVFKEVMRMYPPFRLLSYETKSKCPFNFFNKDNKIVSVYYTHRNPAYWHNPDSFDPSRFENLKNVAKGSFIPFGGTSRVCPGMGLSMFIGPDLLREIFTEFSFVNLKTDIFDRQSLYKSKLATNPTRIFAEVVPVVKSNIG